MELLAPAGNWDAFMAALKNGADAVYIGGKSYSARQSAENFDLPQIESAVDYAHLHNKKVYVTVNTLIDNDEFAAALDYLYALEQRQVDAIIIQDIGLAAACHRVLPKLRLHASTQMTVHNEGGAAFIKKQGFKRIVLARELANTDIKTVHEQYPDVELEVFVHGALCFSYSGQCLFSSMVGGRSGNRGRCAQPCRLAYQLKSRSGKNNLDPARHGRYLLSPADLCLIEYLPELKEAGVCSLKIEGRMKRPEYVAVVSRAYREALDLLEDSGQRPEPEIKENLLKVFNRNFSSGYFFGAGADFLSTRRPNNRGVFVGRVVEQKPDLMVKIKLTDAIGSGDGLVVWVGKGKNPVVIVEEMQIDGQRVNEATAGDIVSLQLEERVFPGDRVFKTHDEELLSEAQHSIRDEKAHKIYVDAAVSVGLGEPLRLILCDDEGNRGEAQTKTAAQMAEKYALDEEVLRDKLGRMGNTDFVLRNITIQGEGGLMLPFSDLNEVRRLALERLIEKRLLKHAKPVTSINYFNQEKQALLDDPRPDYNKTSPLLTVAVSSVEQARLALKNGADQVLLGLEGMGSRKRPSRSELKEMLALNQGKNIPQVIPVLPRISLPQDRYSYHRMVDEDFSALMVGNWGDLHWGLEQGFKILTDYSLNVFNIYSLKFLSGLGISSVCLSPELNFKQLHSFKGITGVEMIIHGELQLMEAQYCVLGATLGGDREKCTAPCSKDTFYLQDAKSYQFPAVVDADCRFHVFNSRTLCMIEDLARIISLRPHSLRIEARLMQDDQLSQTVKTYRQAINILLAEGEPDLNRYKNELAALGQPFTKCHYYRGVI
ncbi:Peptidase U32 [Syntrophomonas zehnderi OL-4]|uniref:Peptidase U32 n=2 Tax=Syntrophomonas TaxID=862 RepID=A0A0E3W370_9FIRM|nr:Peptidase U32 [Syntrophomonas zehnderi OL-4]